MAGKMDALYNRAAARDFIDLDAAISQGRYTLQRLCDLASAADPGFDPNLFATMLDGINRLTDRAFAPYGLDPQQVAELRERVRQWRADITRQAR